MTSETTMVQQRICSYLTGGTYRKMELAKKTLRRDEQMRKERKIM